MSKLKKYDNFLNESYIDEQLPEVTLDELVPEETIYELFERYGYDAFDVSYSDDNLEITVSPKSNKFKGEFGPEFNDHMKVISDEIGAHSFDYSATMQVVFYFSEKENPELVKK